MGGDEGLQPLIENAPVLQEHSEPNEFGVRDRGPEQSRAVAPNDHLGNRCCEQICQLQASNVLLLPVEPAEPTRKRRRIERGWLNTGPAAVIQIVELGFEEVVD